MFKRKSSQQLFRNPSTSLLTWHLGIIVGFQGFWCQNLVVSFHQSLYVMLCMWGPTAFWTIKAFYLFDPTTFGKMAVFWQSGIRINWLIQSPNSPNPRTVEPDPLRFFPHNKPKNMLQVSQCQTPPAEVWWTHPDPFVSTGMGVYSSRRVARVILYWRTENSTVKGTKSNRNVCKINLQFG